MKQLLFTLAAGAILVLAAGCGQPASQSFSQDDLYLAVNGAQYRCNMDIDTVIDDLGAGYQYAEGMSCDYDGLDKTFAYDVAVFYTNPLSEGDLISEIYTESADVSTSRGISVSSTREEVLAAYGEDNEDLGFLLIYRLPDDRISLCFEIEDGAVWAIYLTNQSV